MLNEHAAQGSPLLHPGLGWAPPASDAQRQLAALRALQGLTLHALAHLDEPNLPFLLLEQVCSLLGASSGALYRIGPATQLTLIACSQTPHHPPPRRRRCPPRPARP
jgi:hypothetical protein